MLFTNRETKAPAAPASGCPAAWGGLFAQPSAQERDDQPAAVHHGMIGRGHVGKTALFRVLRRGTLQYDLPSGLQFDVHDPTALNGLLQQYRQTTRTLHQSGLAQTVESEEIDFRLYEGHTERVVIHSAEVIGQILTNTTQNSSAEHKAKYAKYLSHLAKSDVVWVVIPVPPQEAGPDDVERYENDLVVTRAYLREALRLRQTERPCSVAVTLTKIDSLFADEAQARAALTDEALIEALQPLVTMLRTTEKVANAVICPVSAFGFGKAVVCPDFMRDDETHVPEAGELEWILKPDASPEPFNLSALVLWTTLCGLLHQEVDESAPDDAVRVCRLLAEDLEANDGWYVPVKGPLTARA